MAGESATVGARSCSEYRGVVLSRNGRHDLTEGNMEVRQDVAGRDDDGGTEVLGGSPIWKLLVALQLPNYAELGVLF